MIALLNPIVLLALVMLASPASQAAPGPQRIVSLSLCTDELVLALVEREHIASLSYLSADPRYSAFASRTRGLHLNHGQAEEVLALQPDLILGSRFSASASVNLLRRLGHGVTVLGFPGTLEHSYRQIREVAALLAEADRGEALVRQMQEQIRRARQQMPEALQGSRALFYSSNGISYGAGSLRHYFLESLGWRNLAAQAGIRGPGMLDLESLVAARPDYLIVDSRLPGGGALAHHMLQHPALRHLSSADRLLVLPDRLFQCGGPALAEAYRLLAEQLQPLARE